MYRVIILNNLTTNTIRFFNIFDAIVSNKIDAIVSSNIPCRPTLRYKYAERRFEISFMIKTVGRVVLLIAAFVKRLYRILVHVHDHGPFKLQRGT